MVFWRGKALGDLSRSEIETLATHAIEELISIKHSHHQRYLQDTYLLSFGLGIGFALLACFVGVSLH
jgi:hypothetical protein